MAVSIASGASYAPSGERREVVGPDEFRFAAAFLDHGHIYGQTNGLLEAGGTLVAVYDPDPVKVQDFLARYPGVRTATSFEALLADDSLHLIASAAVPELRAGIGARVIESGKDYFTDKSPFTTLAQLAEIRALVDRTGRKYLVYYAERVHNEAAWHAGELVAAGAVGRVLHVTSLAPHRLSAPQRPDWFFDKSRYGGIITDIGSHQVEQFLTYAACADGQVSFAAVSNRNHPQYPGLEDFGEFALEGDNGATFFSRVDWFTPEGMEVWGDGRTFILGTEGSIEARKYTDLGRRSPASLLFLTDASGTREIDCLGKVGFPFFGQLILDVLNRTEHAMTQAHTFKAAELSLLAQAHAEEGE